MNGLIRIGPLKDWESRMEKPSAFGNVTNNQNCLHYNIYLMYIHNSMLWVIRVLTYRKKYFIMNDDVEEAMNGNTLLSELLYHQVG